MILILDKRVKSFDQAAFRGFAAQPPVVYTFLAVPQARPCAACL